MRLNVILLIASLQQNSNTVFLRQRPGGDGGGGDVPAAHQTQSIQNGEHTYFYHGLEK